MISFDDILVVIPARGGSKGLPGKNIKKLAGKPLILYTTEYARSIFKDYQICVSTDSDEIKQIVESSGLPVPFKRPDELATDHAKTEKVIKHALEFYLNTSQRRYEAVLLLQPTSPFRKIEFVEEAMSVFSEDVDMVLSVHTTKSNPYFTLVEEGDDGHLRNMHQGNFSRRQDCPEIFQINGSIYLMQSESLLKEMSLREMQRRKLLIPKKYGLDIDDEDDWKLAEMMIGIL